MEETPMYEHDCEKCRFLGRYRTGPLLGQVYDLYVCQGVHETVLISRFGNCPEDHECGLREAAVQMASTPTAPLAEALRRAVKRAAEVPHG